MSVIYLVMAASGDYEEYRTRPVIAFQQRRAALDFARWAYEWGVAALQHLTDMQVEWHDIDRWRKRTVSPYDPAWDGDDTSYSVREIDYGSTARHETYQRKPFRKTKISYNEGVSAP